MEKWKFAVLAAVMAVSGFAGGAMSGKIFRAQPVVASDAQEQLMAQTFTVVDKAGNARMGLTTSDDDNTPMIIMMDSKGAPRFVVGMSDADEPVMTMADGKGKMRALLTVLNAEGPSLQLLDASENAIWQAPE